MKRLFRSLLLVAGTCCAFSLGACVHSQPVVSSGTPVNPFADPGGQNMPGQRATGAAARSY